MELLLIQDKFQTYTILLYDTKLYYTHAIQLWSMSTKENSYQQQVGDKFILSNIMLIAIILWNANWTNGLYSIMTNKGIKKNPCETVLRILHKDIVTSNINDFKSELSATNFWNLVPYDRVLQLCWFLMYNEIMD